MLCPSPTADHHQPLVDYFTKIKIFIEFSTFEIISNIAIKLNSNKYIVMYAIIKIRLFRFVLFWFVVTPLVKK